MSTEELILKTLKEISSKLEDTKTDYCNAGEAIKIMSLTKQQQLKYLTEKGFLMRYPRGNGFRYKKSECRATADKIDQGIIWIPA